MSMKKNLFIMMSQYGELLTRVGNWEISSHLLSHNQEENAMLNYRKNLMLAINSGNSDYLKRVNN